MLRELSSNSPLMFSVTTLTGDVASQGFVFVGLEEWLKHNNTHDLIREDSTHSLSTLEWRCTLQYTRTGLLTPQFPKSCIFASSPFVLGCGQEKILDLSCTWRQLIHAWASSDISLLFLPLCCCPGPNTLVLVLWRVDLLAWLY